MSKQRKIDYLTDERRLDRRPVADFHVTGGAVGGVGQIEHRYVEHDLLTVGGLDAPLTQLAVWPMRPGVIVIIAAAAIVMCRACGAGPSGRSRRRTKRALRLLQRAAAACAPAIRTGMKKTTNKTAETPIRILLGQHSSFCFACRQPAADPQRSPAGSER